MYVKESNSERAKYD